MLTRIITGIIGIAIATVIIQMGGYVFQCFAIFLGVGAWMEYCRAFQKIGNYLPDFVGSLLISFILAGARISPESVLGFAVRQYLLPCHKQPVWEHIHLYFFR